ncbi:hypothetical protein FNF28_07557 [Cafeteria roenbergensis]|uniref:PH domain-containing protein n=1 Tax=Cafeteria roenbergensis TaxID=33653 RepID=A0A5A8C4C8_CAFRO|nr:hypothetical protein FNF28_07557 [Cafeteria roenbergensis]
MVKLGAIKASWRRRFFVATNEADNFVVYYFERDEHADTPTRKRGAILPCGLRPPRTGPACGRPALGELDRVVGAVVASAWQACKEAAAGRAESLREAATSNLPGAVKDLATGKEALRERVSRVLASAAAEATGPGLDHIVNAFLRPLYKAHKAVVQLFWAHMNAILDRGLKERELRAFFRNCRWQRGELLPAFRRVRAVTRGELPEDEAEARSLLQDMTTTWAELIELLQGVTLWEVERVFEESLIRQATWGVYCFVDAVETGPEWLDPAAALRQVTRAMAGDAVKRARRDMRDVLRLIYSPAAEKAVFDRTAAAAKATRQQFADAAWALDELIDATVDAVVESSQGLRITDTLGRLGKLPGSLGI